MFDIGWTELLVVAVVMILVVGPKDLPRMLRTFGQTLGKVRRMASDFQSTFNEALREAEQQADIADMKSQVEKAANFDPLGDLKKSINVDKPSKPKAKAAGAQSAGGQSAAAEAPSDKTDVAADAETRFLDFLYKRLPIANGAVAMHRKVFSGIRYNPALRQTEDIPVFAHCLANFEAAALKAPTTRIYKHVGSMRHDVDTALKLGMSLVDEVFDENRLPATLMHHRGRYQARRALSVFRLAYRARHYAAAATYYRLAFGANKREALRQPKYVLRYVRCLIASL